jgi:hypothetical protein
MLGYRREEIPWHRHTELFDIFYCIDGPNAVGRINFASNERLDVGALSVGDSSASRRQQQSRLRARVRLRETVNPRDSSRSKE